MGDAVVERVARVRWCGIAPPAVSGRPLVPRAPIRPCWWLRSRVARRKRPRDDSTQDRGSSCGGCRGRPRRPETPVTAREWLVTNGLGGYALGHRRGLADAALPRPADRRPARAVRSRVDAVARRRTRSRSRRAARSATVRAVGTARRRGDASLPLREFALEWGLPVWRYGNDDVELERRIWMPYGQNTVHVALPSAARAGPATLSMRPLPAVPPSRGRPRRRAGHALRAARRRRSLRDQRGRRPARRCAWPWTAPGRRSPWIPLTEGPCEYAHRGRPRVRRRGHRATARASSASTSPSISSTTLVGSTESWSMARALAVERLAARRSRAPPAARGAGAARRARRASARNSCWRPTSSSIAAGRPRRRPRARPGHRRRGAHGDRRLSTGSPTGAATR